MDRTTRSRPAQLGAHSAIGLAVSDDARYRRGCRETGWASSPRLFLTARVYELARTSPRRQPLCWCGWDGEVTEYHEEWYEASDYPPHHVSLEWNLPQPEVEDDGILARIDRTLAEADAQQPRWHAEPEDAEGYVIWPGGDDAMHVRFSTSRHGTPGGLPIGRGHRQLKSTAVTAVAEPLGKRGSCRSTPASSSAVAVGRVRTYAGTKVPPERFA